MKILALLMSFCVLSACATRQTDEAVLTIAPGGSMKHCNVERDLAGGWIEHDCEFRDNAQMALP